MVVLETQGQPSTHTLPPPFHQPPAASKAATPGLLGSTAATPARHPAPLKLPSPQYSSWPPSPYGHITGTACDLDYW